MIDFVDLGSAILSTLDGLFSKKNTKDVEPNHAAIASAIDNVHSSATSTLELLTANSKTFTKIAELLASNGLKGASATTTHNAIKAFCKALGTNEAHMFGRIQAALKVIAADMSLIEKHFSEVFSELKTVDDVKVAHGFVFGYMALSTKTVEFLNHLVYMINIDLDERPPAYIPASLTKDAAAVAGFIAALENRGSRDIMNMLKSIKKDGKNFFLQVDGKPLNEYAHPKDYLPEVSMVLAKGLVLNPAMWVVDILLSIERTRYERNTKMREWMATKISMLELSLNGADLSDPAYKKKKEVLSAYTKMLAGLDKKIADYEQG